MSGCTTRSGKASEDTNKIAMGKSTPQTPNPPADAGEKTLADLFTEFKKKQEGNKRIELKLANIEAKADENTKAIKDHIA